jgi:carotenoid cleavage dioxygenase-like enzyme
VLCAVCCVLCAVCCVLCAVCCVLCACAVCCAGEDDGYLLTYVTKPDGSSYMHVYDAATMDATPVAEVRHRSRPHVMSGVCCWALQAS